MIVENFRPSGATGIEKTDFLYEEHLAGPSGMSFFLLKEKWHTKEDMEKAKRILRNSRDVVSISFVELKRINNDSNT